MSDGKEQSVWDHLDELAKRLRRILFSVVIATVVVSALPSDMGRVLNLDFSGYRPLVSTVIETIQLTLLPEGVSLIAFNWLDTFYIYFLVAVALGVAVTLPLTAFEIHRFISPALFSHEKRSLLTFVSAFTVLFSIGGVYAYLILLPTTFKILYRFVYQSKVIPFFSVKGFFSMVAVGMLGSGIFYTFPLVIYMLVKADLIEVQTLKENRRTLFAGLVIVTAILTPDPTPFSMLLMVIPFYALYEITIQILAKLNISPRYEDTLERGVKASKELLARSNTTQEKPSE